MRAISLTLLLLATVLVSVQCDTIVQTAAKVPQLSTLVSVLSAPGYQAVLQALNSPGNFTVFAPNNDAFTRAGVNPNDVGFVINVLYYHVLGARVHSGDLKSLQFPNSLLTNTTYVNIGKGVGQVLEVSKDAEGVKISFGIPGDRRTTAKVIVADVECSNGVVHIIDTVLLPPNITSVLATEGGLSALVGALEEAKLVSVVDQTASLTIFAPTNNAFAQLPPHIPIDVLTRVLEYHVVPAVAYSTQLSDGEEFNTVEGSSIKVSISHEGHVYVNDARVLLPNVLTENGVVHVIDKVLMPPSVAKMIQKRVNGPSPSNTIVQNAQAVPALSTLVSVLTSPGYEAVLQALNSPGTFTVFAPNNDAFAKAGVDPSNVGVVLNILYYHVLGSVVPSSALGALQFPNSLLTNASFVNIGAGVGQVLEVTKNSNGVQITFGIPGVSNTTATVVIADVLCSNGIVHVIDTVIIPPAVPADVATAGGLTALVNAVVETGLAAFINGTPQLTIFAPTNEAFNAVGPVPLPTLTQVLEYHVISGAVAYSTDLTDGQQVPTVLGPNVKISLTANGVYVNDAKVIVPNVLTQNGVVHVIDKVLLPPQ